MTEKDILIAFLGKTLNRPVEQVAPLLYKKGDDGEALTEELAENALDELIRLDADRVAKLKPNTKEFFDNGFKKAEAEISAKHEKMLREKFGIDTEGKLKGDALLDAIKAAMAEKQDAPMPTDKVKIHPDYLAMERAYQKQLEEKDNEWQNKLRDLETTFTREKSWAENSGDIRKAFKALNPVLSKDAARAEAQVELFVNTYFRDYDFKPTEDGRKLVMKDGARVDNAHGHPLYLDDLVKQTAERLYDFAAQPPAGNAGNNNDGKPTVKIRFKNEDEFLVKYSEAKPEEKAGLAAAWMAQQESQGAGV